MTISSGLVRGKKFWYSESQGNENRRILERYRKIIEYFEQNPERAAAPTNIEILVALHYHDRVLETDESLKRRLFYAMHAADLGIKTGGAQ